MAFSRTFSRTWEPWKLNPLPDEDAVVLQFRADVKKGIIDTLALENPEIYVHPFALSTVLDLATKAMTLFPAEFRTASNHRVRELVEYLNDTQCDPPTVTEDTQVKKREKLDSRAATLKFLSGSESANETPEFERYLATPVNNDVDALVWWKENEFRFPKTAQIVTVFVHSSYISGIQTAVLRCWAPHHEVALEAGP